MSLAKELVAEFDSDFAAGARFVFGDYRDRVRAHPAVPEDTGKLKRNLTLVGERVRNGLATVELKALARSASGADYPTILDTSTGRLVKASSYGHRAFGPFRRPVPTSAGPTRFLSQFRVTTLHVGWWDKVNDPRAWLASAGKLERFNL